MKINIDKHEFTIIWDGVYYFALSDYPNISNWELKKLAAFIEYENKHGRSTEIECGDTFIMDKVKEIIAYPKSVLDTPRPLKITECRACRQQGCLTDLLCHTASPENAVSIIKSGRILSAVKARGLPAYMLASESRNAAFDPADYFDYVMFSWGNCQAGDRLVIERRLGKTPEPGELGKGFCPGVRFFFKYDTISGLPGFVFDGYHPAKVIDGVELEENLLVCVIPEIYKPEFVTILPESLKERIFFIDSEESDIWEWSEKVYDFAKRFR